MPERKKRKLAAGNSQIVAYLTANRQLFTSLRLRFTGLVFHGSDLDFESAIGNWKSSITEVERARVSTTQEDLC